jgi:hypothetical protein
MYILYFVVVWVVLSILVGQFWRSRGHSLRAGIIWSIVASPLLAFLFGLTLTPNYRAREERNIIVKQGRLGVRLKY